MKQKTYLDTLMENNKFMKRFNREYKELVTEEEYQHCNGTDGGENKKLRESLKKQWLEFHIKQMKRSLKEIKEKYKDDPQALKLLSTGYKEMIKKLEEENAIKR